MNLQQAHAVTESYKRYVFVCWSVSDGGVPSNTPDDHTVEDSDFIPDERG